MSDDQNYAQQVKRASAQSETRFGFPSPEELGKERIEAREVMKKSTIFRWAKFKPALNLTYSSISRSARRSFANCIAPRSSVG